MNTEKIAKLEEELGCINSSCDKNGTVIGNDGEPEQCEFCYSYRFPAMEAFRTALTTSYTEGFTAGVEKAKTEVKNASYNDAEQERRCEPVIKDILSALTQLTSTNEVK